MADWHTGPVDQHGNVACKVCATKQSPTFRACICCCEHDNLEFSEEWDNGWQLVAYCEDCGKNFNFSKAVLIKDYRIVKKKKCEPKLEPTIRTGVPEKDLPPLPQMKITYQTVDETIKEVISREGWGISIPKNAKIISATFNF